MSYRKHFRQLSSDFGAHYTSLEPCPWVPSMEKFLASLPERPQPIPVRFGFTLLIMGLCALVEIGIVHLAGSTAFFLLLPGIFTTGIIFDRGSAFFATFLALAFATYLSAPSTQAYEAYEQAVPLFLFGITGLAVAFVSEALRTTMERLIKAERTKDMLLRELDHRTKNNMMSMASVLRLQARMASNPETKDALRSSARRIQVMANIHDHLTPSSPDRAVNMSHYLEELCQKIEEMRPTSGVAVRTTADEIVLPEKKALPLSFIVNELVTNSLKYAFPEGRDGVIDVALKSDGELVLAVSDNGIGRDPHTKTGVGTRLVDVMVQQLDATMQCENANPGYRVSVRIPQPD